jgi:hypothetical protein
VIFNDADFECSALPSSPRFYPGFDAFDQPRASVFLQEHLENRSVQSYDRGGYEDTNQPGLTESR